MIQIRIDEQRFGNLKRMLKTLPTEFDRDQVMMKIFRKASKPMLNAGRVEAQASVPNLARYLDFRFAARKNRYGDIMRVGVLNQGHGKLAHIFDAGTADRFTSDGEYRGSIDKTGFWARAVSSSEPQVVAKIKTSATKELDKYTKKYNL